MRPLARFASAFALAACMALCLAAPALANSARTHWEGVSATGVIVAGSDIGDSASCPIVVERETLTFDVQQLPREHYEYADELAAYRASVTAEYEFANPADYAVSATLLFPFGKLPDYLGYSDFPPPSASERYGVSIDGEPASSTVRHTLSYGFEEFDLERDLARMADGYVPDAFYRPDLPVTRFSYEVSGMTEDAPAATIGFRWTPRADAKVLMANQSGLHSLDDGEDSVMLSSWAENGMVVDVYVFGNAPDGILAGLFEDGSCEGGLDGRITNVGSSTMTFEEFALQAWREDGGVLRHDWYNAMVADLLYCERGHDGVVMRAEVGGHEGFDLTGMLMRWYEYELALKPGQSVENEVTAPLYPAINADFDPPVYGYSYLLSPARTWAGFGRLDVAVNTPFYLVGSSFDGVKGDVAQGYPHDDEAGFRKVEGGYALSLDGLPEGELAFSLSAEERPGRVASGYAVWMGLMFGGAILAVVALAALAGLAIGFVAGRLRRRGLR